MILISDEGQGFDMQTIDTTVSNGLRNLKQRTHLLNGDMDIHSNINHGTKICITIPL